jgi:hypothetical protein
MHVPCSPQASEPILILNHINWYADTRHIKWRYKDGSPMVSMLRLCQCKFIDWAKTKD